MGVEEETGDGHRVYWPERRIVTVERSIRFTFNDEVIVGVLLLEGENRPATPGTQIVEQNMERPATPTTQNIEQQTIQPIEPSNEIATETPETVSIEPVEVLGRGRRIRRDSEYVKLLKQGTGVTGTHQGGSLLPRGIPKIPEGSNLTTEDFAMATVMASAEGIEPTYEEAQKRSDWPKWHGAIQVELKNLEASGTWKLVKRPPNANVVDCRWVLHIKNIAAGEIEKYKARLVVKGFTQIYGVDYYETYAPVAKLASFRLLLALAAQNGWPVDPFDFDSAS